MKNESAISFNSGLFKPIFNFVKLEMQKQWKISMFLLWYFVLTNVVYIVVIFWRFLKIWLLTENCYLATLLRCQLSRRRAMMGFQKQSQQSRKHRTFFQELMIVPDLEAFGSRYYLIQIVLANFGKFRKVPISSGVFQYTLISFLLLFSNV